MSFKINAGLNQFNGGELSPQLEGRNDLAKYNYSAKLFRNFVPKVEGYMARRNGSHFVREVKYEAKSNAVISIRVQNEKDIPILVINGKKYTNLKYSEKHTGGIESKTIREYTTEYLTFYTGVDNSIHIECLGYDTIDTTLNVSPNAVAQIEVYTLKKTPLGELITVNVIPYSDKVELFLNNKKTNTIEAREGEIVTWSAQTLTETGGGYFIVRTPTMVLYKIDDKVNICDGTIIDSANDGHYTYEIPNGIYDVICCGGGGGCFQRARKKHQGYEFGNGHPSYAITCKVRIGGRMEVVIGKAHKSGIMEHDGDFCQFDGEPSKIGDFVKAGCIYKGRPYINPDVLIERGDTTVTYKSFGTGAVWETTYARSTNNKWKWGYCGYILLRYKGA